MFPPGNYKTMIGLRATVAQVKVVNKRWVLIGVVRQSGILILHMWNVYGKSLSNDTRFDLTGAEK